MSGIFGIVDSKRKTDVRASTVKMSKVMSHREWFVAESFVDDDNYLAIGRIGIGIFNKMPQPIWNSSHTIALVMAGEFYNKDVLDSGEDSKSDEQVALSLYENLGDDFVTRLNGVFIIAVYDKFRNQILIVNDRFGMYPLYYAFIDGYLIFSPEMKGVLCENSFPKKLDLIGLAQYVRFQLLLGQRTFFENIRLLPCASRLKYNLVSRDISINSYWSFGDIPFHPDVNFNEAVEEAGMLLRRAVVRLTSDDYRPGVYLSGGLDSRLLVGLVERRPIISITYGTKDCRDVYYASRIARAVGSDHTWVDLPDGQWVKQYFDFHLNLTEGFHSWIHAHGINTLIQARGLFDVNLTGWDGGSIMGHYDSIEPLQINAVDTAALTTRLFYLFNQKYTWPSITEAEETLLYCEPIYKQIRGLAFDSFRTEISSYLNYRPDVRGEYFYIHNHMGRLTRNIVTFLRSHIEVRFPYFDYDLFSFLYSLPSQIRADRVLHRAVIQRETPRLAYIPYDKDELLPTTRKFIHDGYALQKRLLRWGNRNLWKVPSKLQPLYADYSQYLRSDLREWAENILFDNRTSDRGIFDSSYLHTLMKHHLSDMEEWTIGKIAPLITYEMMLRKFYD